MGSKKRKRKKLGRSFDSIMEEDNDASHRSIYSQFLTPEKQETPPIPEASPPPTEIGKTVPAAPPPIPLARETETGAASPTKQPGPTQTKSARAPVMQSVPRRKQIGFLWYENRGGRRCSGLGRTEEVGDKGMVIETPRALSPGSRLHIEVASGIGSGLSDVVSCVYKDDCIYLSELRFTNRGNFTVPTARIP